MTLQTLCTPRPSVFAADRRATVLSLDTFLKGQVHGKEFFEENYFTSGMLTLVDRAFRQLSGTGAGSSVFLLSQAMGGGKTHSMIALGLLAKDPELRKKVLGDSNPAPNLGRCRVVGFNGRSTDARGGIWGSIAEQLGKAESFATYVSPLLSAPGPEAWKQLLGGDPVVIFLDELPPYLEYAVAVPVGNADLSVVTTAALANLFVAVGEMENVCLVISDLAGTNYNLGQSSLQTALNPSLHSISSESRRIAVPITPVNPNGDELYHILRKRLFENEVDTKEIEKVAEAYREALREASKMGLTTTSPESLYTRITDAYPFHPDLRELVGKFKENDGFQQTRGVIRLMQRVQIQNGLLPTYGENFNPMLRCIVRRTRAYLEATTNPATGGYFLPKVTVKLFGEENEDALVLGGYLRDAYEEAENFSILLQKRVKGAGFFKTLLLRRLGSSMEAGRRTVSKLLGQEPDLPDDEDDDELEDDLQPQLAKGTPANSDFKDYTDAERESLERCLTLLKEGGNNDPKLDAVIGYLRGTQKGTSRNWLDLGCILFSQYYDTVRWIGNEMAKRDEFTGMDIGLYAGSNRSGFWRDGKFQRCDRNVLKDRGRSGDLKLLLGTDAASEGLNLQRLGTLINIDLPWNPTRLEQRKGRIQRIGQARSEIWIANLRYRDSVEDKVHQVLADRLEAIHGLFGQIPDTLEDVWVQVALNDADAANQLIDRTTATRNPFDVKYSKVEDADWETCSTVLDPRAVKEQLSLGW